MHVLANGELESHSVTMKHLIERLGLPEQDMFRTAEDLKDQAYTSQEQRIAYTDKDIASEPQQAQQ